MKRKIGIDFGTTNCSIGRVTVEGNISTQGPIASTMAWRNGEYFFGSEAQDLLRSDIKGIHAIREVKMALGTHEVKVGRERIPSVQAASKLIEFVCQKIGGTDEVEKCVMATPITSTFEHRQALRRASEDAGISDMRFVYEPTAALIGAEGEQMFSGRHRVLVVDWGGGTLDLSVVQAFDGSFRELAVGGDHFELGGGKIDEEIAKRILLTHPEVDSLVNQTEGAFERLKYEIEFEKIDIVDDLDGENAEERLITLAWLENAILIIEPKEVFRVLRDFSQKATGLIAEVLRTNNIPIQDITHVAFAGGTCNSSLVRKSIMSSFPYAKEILSTNSQLLTGDGCARLVAREFWVELSRGFGIRQTDQSICTLLPGGHPIDQDTYRIAELLVADTDATEAIIECGLNGASQMQSDFLVESDEAFKTLDTIFVNSGEPDRRRKVAERILLFAGIDRDLAVTIHAKARISGNSETRNLIGLPLAIRFD